MLCEKLDFGFSAIAEILLDSILDDEKTSRRDCGGDEIEEPDAFKSGGTFSGSDESQLLFSAESAFDDCTGGIGFYQFLEETAKHFEEKKGEVIAKLKETAARLFTKENMLISYDGSSRRSGRA